MHPNLNARLSQLHTGQVASGYWASVVKAYLVAMPVAFFCVMLVRPVVMRLVTLTVDVNGEQ